MLQLAGLSTKTAEGMTWVFHCLDGYADPVEAGALGELDVYLAIGEEDVPGQWTPVLAGKEHKDPGPFLAVSATGRRAGGFTWPYQLIEIERLRFEDRYGRVLPVGAEPGGAVDRGFYWSHSKSASPLSPTVASSPHGGASETIDAPTAGRDSSGTAHPRTGETL